MDETVTIRARYDDRERFAHGLRMLKESGIRDYEAYGPVNLREFEDLMPTRGSRVRLWSYVGAIFGLVSFWYLCVATSVVYGLVVGGKPPAAKVPYVIISYEGTILMGSIAAFLGVLVLARLRPRRLPPEYDPRFSGTDFGIVVRTSRLERDRVMGILSESGAMEVNELD